MAAQRRKFHRPLEEYRYKKLFLIATRADAISILVRSRTQESPILSVFFDGSGGSVIIVTGCSTAT
ncbi:hypothetical protein [Candidatus Nitrotoga fabula]|uniref:hypothetical protein n=1 Tax=Candidatus Nitrotoga fabula TaxID=2182327 RepID=UPI001BB486A8|nr:hypothetical protein [Candidatus Nitrotoga fabula]